MNGPVGVGWANSLHGINPNRETSIVKKDQSHHRFPKAWRFISFNLNDCHGWKYFEIADSAPTPSLWWQ